MNITKSHNLKKKFQIITKREILIQPENNQISKYKNKFIQ